jgi:V/A-type H+-transporting ATPase subunit E
MSEMSLDKLIATLKSEAIEAADLKAQEILDQAEAQAEKIVKEAEEKRAAILDDANQEAQAILSKGKGALKLAARDLSVSVQNEILKLLKAALEREVKTYFSPNLMEKAILKLVENVGSGVALKLPENMDVKLADKIQQSLQASSNLDSISTDARLLDGFSIAKTGRGWSYQVSPAEVAELLNAHLSPRWVEILKNEGET